MRRAQRFVAGATLLAALAIGGGLAFAVEQDASSQPTPLEQTAQEERAYRDAAGDLARLRAYLASCRVCAFKDEAERAIDGPHKTCDLKAVSCWRPGTGRNI